MQTPEKFVDYIGLLGRDPMQLNAPEAKAAWERMRNMAVFGEHKWQPPVRRKFQWQDQALGIVGRSSWVKDNLPKGLGKTRSLFDTAEEMGIHCYMNYPGMNNDELTRSRMGPRRYITTNSPIQEANSRWFHEILENLKVKPESDMHVSRIPILYGLDRAAFDTETDVIGRGLLPGQFSAHNRMPIFSKTKPYSLIMAERLRELGKPVHICLEDPDPLHTKRLADIVLEYSRPLRESGKALRIEMAKPRKGSTNAFLLDSLSHMQVWDEVHVYDYNPDEWLTRLYAKEREKKFDHKAAVNRVLKHNKFHDKKGTARRLEFIGAGYEKELKAKKNADKSAE